MSDDPARRAALAVFAGLAALAAAVAAYLLWPTPQLGGSDQVYRTVDALYTAVREQDVRRLGECEGRLKGYAAGGQLPPAAARRLQAVIDKARGGGWRPAAESLYEFMAAQRRDPAPKDRR